ncbi:MAG: type II secretion system protein [Candidatus Omnitrophota bacterium]
MKHLINKNKGFTLIEIFLTASLFGIILVTIFATYASGIRIWKTVKQVNLIADRKFVLTMEKVKREILGYVRNFEDIQFKGDRESFSFPAVVDSDIVELTYFYDKGEDALMRKTVKYTDSLKEKMKKNETTVFPAKDVEFSYLFYDEVEGEISSGWVRSFEQEDDGIPKAVKLVVEFEKPGEDKEITEIIFLPE